MFIIHQVNQTSFTFPDDGDGCNRTMMFFMTSMHLTCYSQKSLEWDTLSTETLSHTTVAAGATLLHLADEKRAVVEQEHTVGTAGVNKNKEDGASRHPLPQQHSPTLVGDQLVPVKPLYSGLWLSRELTVKMRLLISQNHQILWLHQRLGVTFIYNNSKCV